ncbi:hypothetical protein PV326_006101 [Microctonus aethiopoides]|nr:hypothetical protein PV326_006101 [Microctonus aethiopoides]
MDKFINDLQCQDTVQVSKTLEDFSNTHASTMQFSVLNENNARSEIWRLLFEKLSDEKSISIYDKCLVTLRILSRDKTDLDSLITDERLNIVISKANLSSSVTYYSNDVILEALKLICNLIYNSTSVQIQILKTSCLSNLVKRLSTYNASTPYDLKLFDVRILFLVTAFNITSRNLLKYELMIDDHLINILENLFNKKDQNEQEKKESVAVACEVLKTLFNLYTSCDDSTNEYLQKYKKLVDILYNLLIEKNYHGKDELQNHVINLLVIIPSDCYDPITKTITSIDTNTNDEIYNNMDMSAISELLKFLELKLNDQSSLSENLLPVLTALLKICCHDRLVRKYCRQKVLPPLTDVMKRPEEGTNLKAKLCKLLVSPSMELKNLVAEFMFVLCKENVGRMIKYTGYGNAAGMFANKGLLGCKQPQTNYSSDSEESDTEEYTKYKDDINPVTGCYEEPKPNPLEGMTEEQKEYEAMKLVDLVNQLTNDGIVRPCTIDKDGKPKPIDHVLELQESLKHQLQTNHESDSD